MLKELQYVILLKKYCWMFSDLLNAKNNEIFCRIGDVSLNNNINTSVAKFWLNFMPDYLYIIEIVILWMRRNNHQKQNNKTERKP